MRRLIVGLAVAAVACSDFTAPPPFLSGEAAALEFKATRSGAYLRIGDTIHLAFTLRNPTVQTITLSFTGCGAIRPSLFKGDDHVWTRNVGCPGGDPLVLPPGQEIATSLRIVAISGKKAFENFDELHLPRGKYTVFAELGADLGRTNPIGFVIE